MQHWVGLLKEVKATQGPARDPLNQFCIASYRDFKACSIQGIKSALSTNIHLHFLQIFISTHDSVGIPRSSRLTEEVRTVLGREDLAHTEGVSVWERQGDRRLHQAKTLKPALILNL